MSESETLTRHPLCWPTGKSRTQKPEQSRFDVASFASARDSLLKELKLLGAKNVVISSNLRLRQDGLPLANQSQPADTGIAVYFTYKGKQTCFACDRWKKIEDNIQAIRHTIAAIRGIARWGTGDMLDAAFSGFAQLPQAGTEPQGWWSVIGLPRTASAETIRERFRELLKEYHPDRNPGDDSALLQYYAVDAAYQKYIKDV